MTRILTLLAIFGFAWTTADADCPPTAINSTFASCFGRSPVNHLASPVHQYMLEGTLADANGPCTGISVELRILNPPCDNPVVIPSSISEPSGRVEWDPLALAQGGGACLGTIAAPVAAEIVYGTTVLWTFSDVRSPDVDGDGAIGLADLLEFRLSFVHFIDPHIGDQDCNGTIDLSDLARFQNHFIAS